MEATKRKALATTLKQGRYKWHTLLPVEAGTFCGKRIGIQISALGLKTKDDPPLSVNERRLLQNVLINLPKLIRRAEAAFWAYHGDPDYLANASEPHIWLNREDQQSGRPSKWTFVVGLRDSAYAWHIEFSGLRFKQIWAGS